MYKDNAKALKIALRRFH